MTEWEAVASQVGGIMESLKSISDAHTSLVGIVEEIRDGAKETIDTINDNVKEMMNTFQGKLEELDARVNTIMKVTGSNDMKTCGAERTKVLEPKAFGGARDAKEVDNFLFDMELFFRVTKRESEEDKLLILPLYLVDDAKLWWRNKIVRAGLGANQVTSWDMFAKELRAQFCPENVAYDARCKLGEL
uniref:Retrotransposon gag domain-containing protein n=1 Tax=Manihot esculenta TaxID=3983 RepID=A0A2C9U578_MANES